MKRLFCFLIPLLFLAACSDRRQGEDKKTLLSNFLSITDNEDKGIKKILNFYGGYCEYSVGATFSTAEAKKKSFELKLSKSETLDKFSNTPEIPATNLAYLFFTSLKEEKKNYNEIESVLLFNNRDEYKASYSTDQLKAIEEKMAVLNKVVDIIKFKRLNDLKPLLSDEAYTEELKNNLIENIQTAESTFGNVKEFQLYGFRFETQNDFNVLNILGVILRDKQHHEFSLKVDMKPLENKIHYLEFKFAE